MIVLSAGSANELFAAAYRAVCRDGTTVSPRGMPTTEILGSNLCLSTTTTSTPCTSTPSTCPTRPPSRPPGRVTRDAGRCSMRLVPRGWRRGQGVSQRVDPAGAEETPHAEQEQRSCGMADSGIAAPPHETGRRVDQISASTAKWTVPS